MTDPGTVIEINGPLVRARLPGIASGEQVRLGKQKLTGEVIGLDDDRALIQVYESTEMLRPGETVIPLGYPLSVELGPGLLGGIFDGIQRPLTNLREQAGDYIPRGLDVPALERDRPWAFVPNPDLKAGQEIRGGMALGTVQETASTEHRILTPPGVHGELLELAVAGEYDLKQVIARVHTPLNCIQDLKLFHRWPVRIPRPYQKRDDSVAPLLTGQRILDTFFPLLKGGKGAIPGPFGAGKTMLQHKRVFDLVIDFGTSQSPKSTRPLTTYWCPSRPGHQALRNNFASSLLLRTWLPMTGRRVRRPTLLPLWRYAHDG